MPKIRRTYKGAATSAVLSAPVTSATATSLTLTTSPSDWPTGKFSIVVAPGTANEEKMCVTVSGNTITVVSPTTTSTSASSAGRGYDNTTARSNIPSGSVVYPVFTAVDADEANELASTYSTQGQIVYQGASTFAALGIGTAGQVLKVNSGATAPEWGQVGTAGIADSNVTLAKLATLVQNGLAPVGSIMPYGGASAPTGWLLCDGSTFNATTYSGLNTVLGGNTLPDLRARVPMGKAASGTGSTLLGTGGNRKIASNHLPEHTHTINHDHASFDTTTAGTHNHTVTQTPAGDHGHGVSGTISASLSVMQGDSGNFGGAAGFVTANAIQAVDSSSYIVTHSHSFSGSTSNQPGNHSHSVAVTNGEGSHAHAIDVPSFSGSSGDGDFANDDYFQPFVAVNYIIKHDYV